MHRRRLLTGSAAALSLSIAGCTGTDDADDENDTDDNGSDDENGTGEDTPAPDHARSGEDVPGQLDSLGYARGDEFPLFTFGHVSADGEWGVVGSFPARESQVASTLYDLSDLAEPTPVHQLDSVGTQTRTNDVKFDARRDGLYYRSMEGATEGIEVVDFGWEEGTADDPTVVATFTDVDSGVHKLTTHPEEPVLYLVDTDESSEVGFVAVDVSTPRSPEIVDRLGPAGFCHDLEYDPTREALHAAFIAGPSVGYVTYDASDPYSPTQLGHFEYAGQPDYTELGEPGFEFCHQAHPDLERDLAIIGDEVGQGVPGGKHIFDVGWDEGSLEDPQPIGFTHSPDALEMQSGERFWWTGHFHDVVHDGDETLLVDGGYRQGVWVCNITDPREPTPTERFATVEGVEELADATEMQGLSGTPPFAWGAVYNEEREFVFATDANSGAYTFSLSAEEARGTDGRGPDGHYDREAVLADDAEQVANGNHGF